MPTPVRLSPLNLSGLVAQSTAIIDKAGPHEGRPLPERVVMWRCGTCDELHEDEDDADACCAKVSGDGLIDDDPAACPVCSKGAYSLRDAADCCLWRDIDAPTRYRMADAVEAGSTWAEQLGITHVVSHN